MAGLATGSGTLKAALKVRKDDLYETPPCAVHALLAVEDLPPNIWEPACGPGAIVRELEAAGRFWVHGTDLVDYGSNVSGIDFLMERQAPYGCEAIVTNPPFKLATEFAVHAKKLVPEVFMLLRLAFLEGLRWQKGLKTDLAAVHVFAPRLPFMHRHGYEGPINSNSGMPFAWFVWRRGHEGHPTIDWLNWREHAKVMEAAE